MIFNMIGESGGSDDEPLTIIGTGTSSNIRLFEGVDALWSGYNADSESEESCACLVKIPLKINYGSTAQRSGNNTGSFEIGLMQFFKKTVLFSTSYLPYTTEPIDPKPVYLCASRKNSNSSGDKYHWDMFCYTKDALILQITDYIAKESGVTYPALKIFEMSKVDQTFPCQYHKSSSQYYYRAYWLDPANIVGVTATMPYSSRGGTYRFYGATLNRAYDTTGAINMVTSVDDPYYCYITYDFDNEAIVDYRIPPLTELQSNQNQSGTLSVNNIQKDLYVFKVEKIA